jgi:hypothetical protein
MVPIQRANAKRAIDDRRAGDSSMETFLSDTPWTSATQHVGVPTACRTETERDRSTVPFYVNRMNLSLSPMRPSGCPILCQPHGTYDALQRHAARAHGTLAPLLSTPTISDTAMSFAMAGSPCCSGWFALAFFQVGKRCIHSFHFDIIRRRDRNARPSKKGTIICGSRETTDHRRSQQKTKQTNERTNEQQQKRYEK